MFLKFEWAKNLNTSFPEETYRCPTSKRTTLTASVSIVRAKGKLAPPSMAGRKAKQSSHFGTQSGRSSKGKL